MIINQLFGFYNTLFYLTLTLFYIIRMLQEDKVILLAKEL